MTVDFAAVDPRDVLAKVAALPITTWNYTFEDASVRHIGPMAQDFRTGFDVGARLNRAPRGRSAVQCTGARLSPPRPAGVRGRAVLTPEVRVSREPAAHRST